MLNSVISFFLAQEFLAKIMLPPWDSAVVEGNSGGARLWMSGWDREHFFRIPNLPSRIDIER